MLTRVTGLIRSGSSAGTRRTLARSVMFKIPHNLKSNNTRMHLADDKGSGGSRTIAAAAPTGWWKDWSDYLQCIYMCDVACSCARWCLCCVDSAHSFEWLETAVNK